MLWCENVCEMCIKLCLCKHRFGCCLYENRFEGKEGLYINVCAGQFIQSMKVFVKFSPFPPSELNQQRIVIHL